MSREAVAEFLMRIDGDEALRKELGTALEAVTEQGDVMSEVASRIGLDFTPDEYAELLDEMISQDDGTLSEAELEAVAGGTIPRSAALPAVQAVHPRHGLQNVRLKNGLIFIS